MTSAGLVTVAEMAAELRVHPMTVRRWIKLGQVAARRVGSAYRIERGEVERVKAGGVDPAGARGAYGR